MAATNRNEDDAMSDVEADDVAEEIEPTGDHPMDSDAEDSIDGAPAGPNDSIAEFTAHADSIFSVAAHPLDPTLLATGSGDNTAALFSLTSAPALTPLLRTDPFPESVAALAFSLPAGAHLLAADLEGHVRAIPVPAPAALAATTPPSAFGPVLEAHEADEIAWLLPLPAPAPLGAFAAGAGDGAVWLHAVAPGAAAIDYLATFYQHAAASTAGAVGPAGAARALLASVAEDGSLAVHAPFGAGASLEQPLAAFGAHDARFAVDGGLNCVAIDATGQRVAAGGPGGQVRVVSLPAADGRGGGGQLVASLSARADAVEALAWAPGPLALLAAGGVDGSIAVFDAGRGFAVRRVVRAAHGEHAVVQVAFDGDGTPGGGVAGPGWMLTSCGMDGVVRRWDVRGGGGGAAAVGDAAQGLVKELRGHRGGGEGGGVLGFVRAGDRIVTAGDDGISLVFDL